MQLDCMPLCSAFSLFKVEMALSSAFSSFNVAISTRAGRREGGVGGEWEISILLNALGIIPSKDRDCVILSNHAGWLWI